MRPTKRAGNHHVRRIGALLALSFASLLASAGPALAFGSLYIANGQASGTVSPFAYPGLAPTMAIPVGSVPVGVALTPDGNTVYVANGGGTVSVINAATGAVTTTLSPIPGGALELAVSPDGSSALVVGDSTMVTPINTATNAIGSPLTVGGNALAVAFAPNGQTAYTANFGDPGSVSVIAGVNTASPSVTTFATGVPALARTIAVTPDGSKIFVAGGGGAAVIAAGASSATPIAGLTGTYVGVAVSPDGTKAYFLAADTGTGTGAVEELDIATGTVTALTGDLGAATQSALAVSPNGSTVYAVLGHGTPEAVAVNTTTGATTVFNSGNRGYGEAITPDQAPVAALTDTPAAAGSATTLNAGATTTADGGSASYAWSFGDGATATTSTPTTTHAYAAAGTYSATVTVTDDQGCSTALIYTGQTLSCNGGPSATKTVAVVVPAKATPATTSTPPPTPPSPQSTNAAFGNQQITLTTPSLQTCTATTKKLVLTLASTAIPKSRATRLRFSSAGVFIGTGIKHTRKKSERLKNGTTKQIHVTTYTANATARHVPTAISLSVKGLKSGSHPLKVVISYKKTVTKHGHKTTVTVTKTVRSTFTVC